jgi:transcriptional regulator with XRE-family HTH domain
MVFGERIRELRKGKNLTQREVADKVGINFTYLSKIENDKLDRDQYPREDTVRKLAEALGADADELLLLAKRIPDAIKQRVLQRPDLFRKMASLDDETLTRLLNEIDK